MRDDQVIGLLSPDAMRALAHYYDCTADLLRRRADHFDPPPRNNALSDAQIFFQIPDFVAEKQRDGEPLERAIDLVAMETGSTRARVELALVRRRRQERAQLTDLRIQQARAMKNAGASVKDIARALGVTERHARRLAFSPGCSSRG